jgi:hypothetical protein
MRFGVKAMYGTGQISSLFSRVAHTLGQIGQQTHAQASASPEPTLRQTSRYNVGEELTPEQKIQLAATLEWNKQNSVILTDDVIDEATAEFRQAWWDKVRERERLLRR